MGLMHPSSIPWGVNTALARLATVDAFAHGLAICGTGLTLLGLVGLSRMLGSQRVPVTAAMVAFALASSAVMVAAALDGFALPIIAQQWTEADKIAGDDLRRLVWFCVLTASSLTRIYLLLVVIAIALWSWVIYCDRLDSALPWVGATVCIAGIAMLFGGSPFVSAHEVLALVIVQAIWMLFASLFMIRSRNGVATTGGQSETAF
jgi:hypothetical protein